ncbi:hypothetical protein EON77_13120, partial [bacterium]
AGRRGSRGRHRRDRCHRRNRLHASRGGGGSRTRVRVSVVVAAVGASRCARGAGARIGRSRPLMRGPRRGRAQQVEPCDLQARRVDHGCAPRLSEA